MAKEKKKPSPAKMTSTPKKSTSSKTKKKSSPKPKKTKSKKSPYKMTSSLVGPQNPFNVMPMTKSGKKKKEKKDKFQKSASKKAHKALQNAVKHNLSGGNKRYSVVGANWKDKNGQNRPSWKDRKRKKPVLKWSLPAEDNLGLAHEMPWFCEDEDVSLTETFRTADSIDASSSSSDLKSKEPFFLDFLDLELHNFGKYVRPTEIELSARNHMIEFVKHLSAETFGKMQVGKKGMEMKRKTDNEQCVNAASSSEINVVTFGSFASPEVCTFVSDIDMAIWGVVESGAVAAPGRKLAGNNHVADKSISKKAQEASRREKMVKKWREALSSDSDNAEEKKAETDVETSFKIDRIGVKCVEEKNEDPNIESYFVIDRCGDKSSTGETIDEPVQIEDGADDVIQIENNADNPLVIDSSEENLVVIDDSEEKSVISDNSDSNDGDDEDDDEDDDEADKMEAFNLAEKKLMGNATNTDIVYEASSSTDDDNNFTRSNKAADEYFGIGSSSDDDNEFSQSHQAANDVLEIRANSEDDYENSSVEQGKHRRLRREDSTSSFEVGFVSTPSKKTSIGPTGREKKLVVSALMALGRALRNHSLCDRMEVRKFAKVPIINMTTHLLVDTDIAIGGHNGMDTSAFAGRQIRKNKSFAPVVLLLKILLRQADLDKPFTGGLGSFKLYVLVAHHIERHISLGRSDRPSEILISFLYRFGDMHDADTVRNRSESITKLKGSVFCDGGVADLVPVKVNWIAQAFRLAYKRLMMLFKKSRSFHDHAKMASALGGVIHIVKLREERELMVKKAKKASSLCSIPGRSASVVTPAAKQSVHTYFTYTNEISSNKPATVAQLESTETVELNSDEEADKLMAGYGMKRGPRGALIPLTRPDLEAKELLKAGGVEAYALARGRKNRKNKRKQKRDKELTEFATTASL